MQVSCILSLTTIPIFSFIAIVLNLEKQYLDRDIYIIGGPEIIIQTFDLFKEFYLTRIYGNFECDKFIDIKIIANTMNLIEKIDCDDTCHFEIWRK